MRKLLIAVGGIALVVAVVVGLSQTGTTNQAPSKAATRQTPAAALKLLEGAAPPLAALHAQASELLPGGRAALRERLKALKGYPIVVNKWASWCGPCRAEFPHFQNASVALGKTIAFLGVNSGDNDGDAADFLREFPVSFPSYKDPNEKLAIDLGAAGAYPVTLFFDATGHRTFIHQGGYKDEASLRADITRYATR